MAYLISEPVIDDLLETAQRAHAKAVASPLWPLVKAEPLVLDLLRVLNALEREVKKAQLPPPPPRGVAE